MFCLMTMLHEWYVFMVLGWFLLEVTEQNKAKIIQNLFQVAKNIKLFWIYMFYRQSPIQFNLGTIQKLYSKSASS